MDLDSGLKVANIAFQQHKTLNMILCTFGHAPTTTCKHDTELASCSSSPSAILELCVGGSLHSNFLSACGADRN